MPLPTPEPDEREADFVGRCMSALSDEFPDADQRAAVCHRQWEGHMDGKLRKRLSVEIKDAEKGLVEAVIATFNVKDHHGDWTLPGAFEDGAKVRISAYGHGSWFGQLPVGKGVLAATGHEARVLGAFFLETTHGRETFETVKAMGDLQDWSYGYDVLERGEVTAELRQRGVVRVLQKVKVYEVSPVLVGASIESRTLALKTQRDVVPLAVVERLCPPCATQMRARGWTGLKWSALDRKQMPAGLLEGLCEAVGGDPGFFTACMQQDFGDFEPGDRDAFCAWLHEQCTGITPAEHRSAALRELARFERTRARLQHGRAK